MAQAHKTVEKLLKDYRDVIAMLGRIIAQEMVVAGSARTAPLRVRFFQDKCFRTIFSRSDSSTKTSDTTTDDNDIRIDYLVY